MHLQENTVFDLEIRVKVTGNSFQYLLHHVTYAPVKFEVSTSNCEGGDAFTRKYIIFPLSLTLTQRSRSHITLLSSLYIM